MLPFPGLGYSLPLLYPGVTHISASSLPLLDYNMLTRAIANTVLVYCHIQGVGVTDGCIDGHKNVHVGCQDES